MTTATHRRRPADANDHRGRLSAGTLRGFQCGRIRLTQLAAAPTHRIHRLSRRQRPGRFAGVDYRDVLCHRPDRDGGRCGAAADQRCPTAEYSAHGLDSGCRHNPGDGRDRGHGFAQLAMGDSWRIGVDEQENTTLVRTGPFKWVRHPIYTAMMAFGLGLLLVTPNLVALAGFILLVATLEVHVRRVEEPYLLRTHSAVYRGYTASVGRFVPGVGLIR